MKKWKRNTKRFFFWIGLLMFIFFGLGLEHAPLNKGLWYIALFYTGLLLMMLTMSWIDDKVD
jgi:hypothetical protein